MTNHYESYELNDKMLVVYPTHPDVGELVKSSNSMLPYSPRDASNLVAWAGGVRVGFVHPKSSVNSIPNSLPSGYVAINSNK